MFRGFRDGKIPYQHLPTLADDQRNSVEKPVMKGVRDVLPPLILPIAKTAASSSQDGFHISSLDVSIFGNTSWSAIYNAQRRREYLRSQEPIIQARIRECWRKKLGITARWKRQVLKPIFHIPKRGWDSLERNHERLEKDKKEKKHGGEERRSGSTTGVAEPRAR